MAYVDEAEQEPPAFPACLEVAAPTKIAFVAPSLLIASLASGFLCALMSGLVFEQPEILIGFAGGLATYGYFLARSLRDADYATILKVRLIGRPSLLFGHLAARISPELPNAMPIDRLGLAGVRRRGEVIRYEP